MQNVKTTVPEMVREYQTGNRKCGIVKVCKKHQQENTDCEKGEGDCRGTYEFSRTLWLWKESRQSERMACR